MVDGIIILKYTQIETSSKIVGLVQDWIACGYQVDTVVSLRGPQKTKNTVPTHSFSRKKVLQEYACYAHGDICKLCGWFGNRWRVVVVVTPVHSPPGLLLLVFFTLSPRPWGIRKFLPWQFPCAVAEPSSWRVGDVSRSARVGSSLSGHMLGGSVSALPVCCLLLFSTLDWLPPPGIDLCFW